MFGLFGKKSPAKLLSLVTFDQRYCHSDGNPNPAIYEIAKGTTDLQFAFPDFEAFWQTYINRNPHVTNETLIALRDGQAVFTASVVQDGEYHYHNGVGDDGSITLNAANLQPMGARSPFPGFTNGALAFGLYHIGAFRFEVLWATTYSSD
ncbi:MAG: hypothetical protein ACRCS3_11785 [Paracoccaceae bacterium]